MIPKLSYTLPEVSQITSICRSRLYVEIAEGRLRRVKVGRATRILADDLEAWLKSLSGGPSRAVV
jgi:excisionase family DNA binding protein